MDYHQLFRSYPVITLLIDPDTGRVDNLVYPGY